jgi:hypothetical protein
MMPTFELLLLFQVANAPLPRFEDFHVPERFTGTPARPVLATPAHRMFRTTIGDWVRKGPNFAGHYTVAEWGCGTACIQTVVVDATSGNVYDTPFGSPPHHTLSFRTLEDAGVFCQNDSRLLVASGCPDDENCGSYYYEWTGSRFRLLRKTPTLQRP